MTEANFSNETSSKDVREAVGVFAGADALQAAVDELERSGIDRAMISVLASDEKIRERIGRLYHSVAEVEDAPQAPRTAVISKASWTQGGAAVVGIPLYIGGAAGAFAVVATGGVLAVAIAAAVTGGAVGAGLGALLARAIAHHHADHVLEQLAQGGMVLWVGVRDANAEKRVLDILMKAGARDVHIHQIQREAFPTDIPLSEAQPDPFLMRDR